MRGDVFGAMRKRLIFEFTEDFGACEFVSLDSDFARVEAYHKKVL